LVFSGIPYAHRFCSTIALQFSQILLSEPAFTAHPKKNLQFFGAAGGTSLDKTSKTVCFFHEPDLGERSYRKTRIPDPSKTVIPVSRTSSAFRQGCCCSSSDRSGRRIAQSLKNHR